MMCPVCRFENYEASLTCSKHISLEYDRGGNLIAYTDMEEVTPNHWQSRRIPVKVARINSPRVYKEG